MQIDTFDTPAERRRVKVREMILAAAERVFATEGADGLSIRRLARKIDYSPAAIYKYFESKEELVHELKEAFFAKLLSHVNSIADASEPFDERARRCVATYMRVAVEKPYHYAAAFAGELSHAGPTLDDPGFEHTKKGMAFLVLRGMVEEGVSSGQFRGDIDATLAAKSIWASMHGLAMMIVHIPSFPALKGSPSRMAREDFIDMHADNVVRGLEAHP